MTHKPDAVCREMNFEPKRAWGEDLICSRCNETIFENGVYVKAHGKVFCHVCVLDQAKINQKQLVTVTADRDKYRRQVAEYDELLCVTCGFNIEIVDFEGEGKRAICRKCEADRDKYRDACERLIGHYGAGTEHWICQVSSCVDATCDHPEILYITERIDEHGYTFARQVKAEIEGKEGQ